MTLDKGAVLTAFAALLTTFTIGMAMVVIALISSKPSPLLRSDITVVKTNDASGHVLIRFNSNRLDEFNKLFPNKEIIDIYAVDGHWIIIKAK